MIKKTRERGQGSITEQNGKHRARLPGAYERRSLGVFADPVEATAILDAALEELAADPFPLGMTLDAWALQALELREKGDHKKRTCLRDRARWATYGRGSLLGQTPLREVAEHDVRQWLDGLRKKNSMRLAPTSVRNALSLVRSILEMARERDLIQKNSAIDVRLSAPARKKVKAARDKWTWLTQSEIDRLLCCDVIPLRSRAAFATSIYAGLRAGELWGLRWGDVDFARGVIHVRHSFEDTPKTHQIREVPMLDPAARLLALWKRVYIHAGVRSRIGLVWPAQNEMWHADGYDAGWPKWRRKARIVRHVRFHDLRHTCASHLVQGTWAPSRIPLVYLIDRPLRLEEVRDWLGHEDITTTQRYAHLCADAVRSLVVSGHGRDTTYSHLPESNWRPTVYETGGDLAEVREIRHETAPVSRDVSHLAIRFLRAVEQGDPRVFAMGVDLAEAALALASVEDDAARPGRSA